MNWMGNELPQSGQQNSTIHRRKREAAAEQVAFCVRQEIGLLVSQRIICRTS